MMKNETNTTNNQIYNLEKTKESLKTNNEIRLTNMKNNKIRHSFQMICGKLSFYFLILFLFISAISAFAQNQPIDPKRGITNEASYSISDLENINMTNGNLMLNFPLVSLPAGRGGAGSSINLVYNSKLYDTEILSMLDINNQMSNQNRLVKSLDGGWKMVIPSDYTMRLTSRIKNGTDGFDCVQSTYLWKLHIILPDGSKKEFRPTGYSDYLQDGFFRVSPNGFEWGGTCGQEVVQVNSGPMTYYSTDGSYLKLVVQHDNASGNTSGANNPWTLYFPDGSNYDSTTKKLSDKNGNFIQSNGIDAVGDQFGRTVYTTPGGNANETFVFMSGVNNEQLKWIIQWKTIYVRNPYETSPAVGGLGRGNYAVTNMSMSFKVVDKIILPTQLGSLMYQFGYNGSDTPIPSGQTSIGWGELISVTLPSGTQANYEYQLGFDEGISQATTNKVLKTAVKKKTLNYSTEYDGMTTPISEVWNYEIADTSVTSANPDGSSLGQVHGDTSYDNKFNGLVLSMSSSNGSLVEKLWNFNIPANCGNCSTRQINPFVKAEFTSIKDAQGNYSLTAIKEFNYDKNGNVTEIKEYDWIPYSSVPRSNGLAVPSGITPLRITKTTFNNPTPDASDTTTNSPNAYWNMASPNVRSAAATVEIQNSGGTPVSRSEIFYDNPNTTANPVLSKTWDSSKGAYSNPLGTGNSISTSTQYNQYGMPILTTDAKGIQTQITYGQVGSVTDLYPTQVKTAFGLPEQRTSASTYDFYTGLVKTTTDVDNNVTNETVYDAVGRAVISKAAINTPNEVWTQMEYNNQLRRVVSRSDLFVKGDGKKVSIQHYDQLGRVRLNRTLEDATTQNPYNEADGIKVQTRYRYDNGANPSSSNGAFTLQSNPYRTGSESEMGWTVSYSDKTGKTSTTKTYAGGTLPAPWGGNSNITGTVLSQTDANTSTVTDQAGRKRKGISDALGRMIQVIEDPNGQNLTTNYVFDTVSNLRQTIQGVQNRYFMYDTLGRLIRAKQPEQDANPSLTVTDSVTGNNQWSVGYTYDNNGNITSTMDARGVTITGTYDNINRLTLRDYSDATPDVTFTYDGGGANIPFSKGKTTQISSGVSVTKYTSFDTLGRIKSSQQITGGQTYNFADYSYNLAGQLVSQTYPSGRAVINVLENDGDLAQVNGNFQGNIKTYTGNISYTSAGAVSAMQFGNGRWETAQLNSRLQVTQIGLGTTANNQDLVKLNYDYGTTDNNGAMKSQQITVQGQFVANQTYAYDSLNRLQSSHEVINSQQTWKQTFQYDRYGNRKFDQNQTTTLGGCPQNVCNPDISTANNRLIGNAYDQAGNVIQDAENKLFFYDAENRQKEVKNASNQVIGQYFYDGEGRRVQKTATQENTIFVYDAFGKMVAEYLITSSASQAPQTRYLTEDHLGSPRVITDEAGNVVSRHDYMAFGEEITRTNFGSDSIRKKYTGYERDVESSLDYAQARYYNSRNGRFTSVDPLTASASIKNPQTFNRYSYGLNSPYKFSDPLGLITECAQTMSCKEDNPSIPLPSELQDYVDTFIKGKVLESGNTRDDLSDEEKKAVITYFTNVYNLAFSEGIRIGKEIDLMNIDPKTKESSSDYSSQNEKTTTDSQSIGIEVDKQGPKVKADASTSEQDKNTKGTNSGGKVTSNIDSGIQERVRATTDLATQRQTLLNNLNGAKRSLTDPEGNNFTNKVNFTNSIDKITKIIKTGGVADGFISYNISKVY